MVVVPQASPFRANKHRRRERRNEATRLEGENVLESRKVKSREVRKAPLLTKERLGVVVCGS